MTEFFGNIEKLTIKNKHYRKVIGTTTNMQLVLMSLRPGEEIGAEVHEHTTQFIRIEAGNCVAIVGDETLELHADNAIIVPPKTNHNIINSSKEHDLKLYTIYTPPEHEPECIQHKKSDQCIVPQKE